MKLFMNQILTLLSYWSSLPGEAVSAHRVRRALAIFAASLAGVCLTAQGLPVTYDRLLNADREPGNWLMYSNTYNSWRYSRLSQIDTGNVGRLKVKWLFQ